MTEHTGVGAPESAFVQSAAGQAFLEAERAKLVRRGEPFGLSADEVEQADRDSFDLARFAAMRRVRNVADYRRVEEEGDLARKAAEVVALERAVEAERRRGAA